MDIYEPQEDELNILFIISNINIDSGSKSLPLGSDCAINILQMRLIMNYSTSNSMKLHNPRKII